MAIMLDLRNLFAEAKVTAPRRPLELQPLDSGNNEPSGQRLPRCADGTPLDGAYADVAGCRPFPKPSAWL